MSVAVTNTNWLAQKFITQREIIEAAETPFSKLAMFILPIISPLVPATMTGMHLFQIFLDVFTFNHSEYLSGALAIVAGLVLELLGYVGAITFIKSTFNYFSTQKAEYLIPMVLNGMAYTFYLVLLFMINYQLGKYLGVNPVLNNIIATLSFVTVPTSLLAGSHLSEKSWAEKQQKAEDDANKLRQMEYDREDKIRQEQAEYKLARHRINRGIPETPVTYNQDVPYTQPKGDWRLLDEGQRNRCRHVLNVPQIMEEFNVSKSTAYEWKKS
jgi:hypothetical protein